MRKIFNRLRAHPRLIAPALASVAASAVLGVLCGGAALHADVKAFRPITSNLDYSTSRDLVDIEIVGSTSLVPREHKLEPERVLRLRIERGYITQFLTKSDPGFSLLTIGIDRPSGLPEALIDAVSLQGRFHQNIEGAPKLNFDEKIRRFLILTINSDRSERSHAFRMRRAASCVGKSIGSDLFEMNVTADLVGPCPRSVYPDGKKWLARRPDGSLSEIECQGGGGQIVGCSTDFVFKQFSVRMQFHQLHLDDWRSVVAFAEAFLASKLMTDN
jgi:hypothetical protein